MKITNEHVGRMLEARLERVQRRQGPQARAADEGASSDRAVFSRRSEDLRVGMAAARAAGRGDEARLAELARAVGSGRYRVPAELVADALLSDLGR
jgi:anti-sigma28 factor (negative regulator of flagellin synthesis)